MQEIHQDGQVLGSRCYQPGRDSRMSGTRRQDGNSTARKSQRKLNKSKAKVRGSPYPQNVTSGKSEKSNSSIAFAISSAVGSDLCQRVCAEPSPSPFERIQKVHLHGHLLVMLKYTWFLYLYMISVVILYFPHFNFSYFSYYFAILSNPRK